MPEDTATQIGLHLALDEARQAPALRFGVLHKVRPVLAHELVEHRLFRPPTLVAVRTREPSYGMRGRAHASRTALRRRLPSTAAGPAQTACRLGGQ